MNTLMKQMNLVVLGLAVPILAGCSSQPSPPSPSDLPLPQSTTTTDEHGHSHEDAHGHGAGPHDGTLADWGGGKYHVEFTVDHGKQEATVYVLAADERTPVPIRTTDGKLLLTIQKPAFQVDLVAQPMEGESGGATSRFVGKHEKLGIVQEFAGTISGEVDGIPYAADFKEEQHEHEPH